MLATSEIPLTDLLMLWGLTAWLGACFGSFSNVLVYRLPRNLNVVKGRSHCPKCSHMIPWYDNVPVVSWLLLRGHCRYCETEISPRYFWLEIAGAACAVGGVWRFGWTLEGLSASVFLLLMVDIALIDWEHMIIPHTLTISGAIFGGLLSFFIMPSPGQALLGAVTGAGIILAVSWGYKLVRGVVGMGGGDVMLMGMIGTFVGPLGVVGVLFAGSLFGAVYAVVAGRGSLAAGAKLPFGTFLAPAGVLVLLYGREIFGAYLNSF